MGLLNELHKNFYLSFISTIFLVVVFFFALTSSTLAWTETEGGDHGGEDWIITTNTTISGNHTNIGTFRINPGITATVQSYNGTLYGTINISAQTIDIQGTLSATGRGFTSSTGTGQGSDGASNNGAGGGGYGGRGGTGHLGIAGGTIYGDLTAPTDLGSAGGLTSSAVGGSGGGVIILTASGSTTITGTVNSNGNNGGTSSNIYAAGGGSGGSIYITTVNLEGSGTITANGGNGGNNTGNSSSTAADGGGGGGGRIALYYTTKTFNGTLQAAAGTGLDGGRDGGVGTIYEKPLAQADGNLTLNNIGRTTETSAQLTAGTYTFHTLNITGNTYFNIPDGLTINVTNSFNLTTSYYLLNTSSSGIINYPTPYDLTTTGTAVIVGGDTKWPLRDISVSSGTFSLNGTYNIRDVIVSNGAILTHEANGATQTYDLQLTANSIDIQTGGSININSKGNSGSNGIGQGSDGSNNNGAGGGSHGGSGGTGHLGTAAGTIYDDLFEPTLIGSAGGLSGAAVGGAGGGAVILDVSNNLIINGSITANGGNGGTSSNTLAGGGGAGGSIYITTATIEGTGSITANGGNGGNNTGNSSSTAADGGAGGGGRIALYYDTSTHSGSVQAAGGTGPDAARDGAPGTIFRKSTGQISGTFTLDNLNRNAETAFQFTTGTYNFENITITGNTFLNIQDDVIVNTSDSFTLGANYYLNNTSTTGIINYPTPYDLNNTGTAIIIGDSNKWPLRDITVTSGTLSLNGSYSVQNVTVESGAILTHQANSTTQSYDLQITASGDITLNGTGSINVNSKGFSSSNGTGQGSDGGTNSGAGGGGYGNPGGTGHLGSAGGSNYGDLYAPLFVGSGGGNSSGAAGGYGGGAVILDIMGTLNIASTASITANGGSGSNSSNTFAGGGGSGGSVYIDTGTLAGSGSITANGGNGANNTGNSSSTEADGGGGGGGRISILYDTNTFSGTIQAAGGIGPDAARDGAPGTIFEKSFTDTEGNLTLNNLNRNAETSVRFDTGTYDFKILNITGNTYFNVTDDVILNILDSFNITSNYFLTNTSSTGIINYPTPFDLTTTGTAVIIGGSAKWPMRDIAVSSGTLSLNGIFSVRNMTVETGSTLTHQPNTNTQTYDLQITASGDLSLNGTGTINVNSKGFSSSNGTGQGSDGGTNNGAGGAGHGGAGGNGHLGVLGGGIYGNITAPITIGSGGGNSSGAAGGYGGGAVILDIAGTTTIGGAITANGGNGSNSSNTFAGGGGSGGSVYLRTGTLTGAGNITANGGNGANNTGNSQSTNADGGGGGGGRVALYYQTSTYTGNIQVNGGIGPEAATDGAIGSSILQGTPVSSIPTSISQATDGSGHITFSTGVTHPSNVDTKLKVEYSDDNGISWYDAELVSIVPSAGTVDLDNTSEYQLGSVDAIDTSTDTINLTIVWDTKSALNGNGSMDDIHSSQTKLRVIVNDGNTDGQPQTSSAFMVDNFDPTSTTISVTDTTSSTATIGWTVVIEANFDHYEIWYGTDQVDVENRTGSASEWDNNDATNLSTRTTTQTEINDLTSETYYFKLWAIDDFGNNSQSNTISAEIIPGNPVLTEVSPIGSTNDNTPSYSFISDQSGTITYGGNCSSSSTSAIEGTNTIIINQLQDGTYSNCTITLTNDFEGEATLNISSFTVDTVAPTLNQITTIGSTNDTTPTYQFTSNEAGSITYSGGCTSVIASAINGTNSITFNNLGNGTYSNCKITVRDNANNSTTLDVTTFIIDTIAPTLTQVTVIGTTDDNTPSYSFTSNEAGTISYTGACSSIDTIAVAGSNTITFNQLADGTYSNCSIIVTDAAGNSRTLNVTSFTVRTIIPPELEEITIIGTTNDATPSYSFSSSKAGTISYGGGCTSSTTSATAGINTITLDSLWDGSYSNCRITVTEALGGSQSLGITAFIIDTVSPILTELTEIGLTNDNTPIYSFSSTENGILSYGANCTSLEVNASLGTNTIEFELLADNAYSDCTIIITDAASNTFELNITSFIVDTTAPELDELNPIGTTNDTTPDYTYGSDEGGSNSYNGACNSGENTTIEGENLVTLEELPEGTYSNCSITVTDNASNSSDLLISDFTIQPEGPHLSEISPIGRINDQTPDYAFTSDQEGDITYEGGCSSDTAVATTGTNTITFSALSEGTFSNCIITVTNELGNKGYLSITPFTIDTVFPTLEEITIIGVTKDNTPSYAFSTDEGGTITYQGDCSSVSTIATIGTNIITLNELEDETYSNCEILVTDQAGNTSSTVISSFRIDTTLPVLEEMIEIGITDTKTPSYSFTSSEAGVITYGGACTGDTSEALEGLNIITLNSLNPGTYINCSITVTDEANNFQTLIITTFIIINTNIESDDPVTRGGTQNASIFKDITSSPFKNYIENLYYRNIINGYSDGSFKPNNYVTRGEMSKFIANAFKITEGSNVVTFTDMEEVDKFLRYIEILSSQQIVNGYSDGTFRSGENVNRGEATKFIVEALKKKQIYTESTVIKTFDDVQDSKFNAYINFLSTQSTGEEYVISGYSDNTFKPDRPITRGEMTKIVWNSMLIANME